MVINKPTGHEVTHEAFTHEDPEVVKQNKLKAIAQLKELLDNGTLEVCYMLISGGHMFVIDAKDTEELAVKVRYNPLFKKSHTEIIPIANAVEYLEGAMEHRERIGI